MTSNNYGPGVSRVLDPTGRSFLDVIFQEGKPPCDTEFDLLQDITNDWRRIHTLRGMPSGWLGNETSLPADFNTNPQFSNYFKFGRQRSGETQSIMWAAVNGFLVPVMGTHTGAPPGSPNDADTTNVITLDPPPSSSGDLRTDFAFLEVWVARISPNPSATNKPASSAVWKYGNVEGGFSFLSDDLVDPALGFETTQRTQLQYRIRVVKGVTGLSANPDGFDPTIKAQGTQAAPPPSGGYSFVNQRLNGDPGLWRAGDGTANTLGTVDGYVYAIPLCAVFRRNAAAWSGDPSPNLNGSFNRNPTATDRTGITTFTGVPTLSLGLTAIANEVLLTSTAHLPIPTTPAAPVLIKIGDELMSYQAIDTLNSKLTGVIRGLNGTVAETHPVGATIMPVSGRPDGLFADQIARTDILDLRHAVNPNGFDYEALLWSNMDKLFRGQLRANWKRSGGGTQGTFVHYQDKITTTGSVGLGVTKLDGPDGIRHVFSDAAVMEPVELIVRATGAALPADVSVSWSYPIQVDHTARAAIGSFTAGDVLSVPVSQFKIGLPGGDADQVRFVNDGVAAVTIRRDGQTTPISPTLYSVTPANPGPNDDLTITLLGGFPTVANTSLNDGTQLYITVNVMYGPGRGLSRRPDSIHSVAYITPSTDLLLQSQSTALGNIPTRIAWAPLWSKYRQTTYKNMIPVTSETYGDLGSKTVVLTPFRRVAWPAEFRTMDGTSVNVAPTSFLTGTVGSVLGIGSTFTDGSKNFSGSGVIVGDVLTIPSGAAAGTYVVTSAPGTTTLTVSPAFTGTASGIAYSISHAQDLMPLLKADGVTPKWASTDPLGMFSGTTEPTLSTKNIYVTLPRHMVPGWGEVRVPVLRSDTPSTTFAEGVNFMCLTKKGFTPFSDGDKNYVPYDNGGLTYATFATQNLTTLAPATYNTAFTYAGPGLQFAGIRLFTDTRGLGRQGLELPPFYGVARLFAVYEAADYRLHGGSAYSPTTRQLTGGGAKNLLRQDFQGPTFWIEIDSDGDSTFILNAETLDLSKSPNPIASFSAGNYVIEASIFGFDRGSFDTSKPFRLVMTRPTSSSLMRSQAASGTRSSNLGVLVAGPTGVLPGPAASTDNIVINYSRTPYQGDAWGTQANYVDTAYSAGAITTSAAYQVVSTKLNDQALTRPNQKALEVLASIAFETTLGTGRLSGDLPSNPATSTDVRAIGYEDMSVFPPTSSIDPRPKTLLGGFSTASSVELASTYHGMTDRLPIGALVRDKDFRGEHLGSSSTNPGPLMTFRSNGAPKMFSAPVQPPRPASPPPGPPPGPVPGEILEAPLANADTSCGAPGNILVHVDGEQGNYALLTNYRTTRGGSAFVASGDHPGGEVVVGHGRIQAMDGHTNVLSGQAFLVRNAVTNVGASEVSPGDELMMVIVTTAHRLSNGTAVDSFVAISTNGTMEGYSAADLYRIEGHPLTSNHVHMGVDPSTIVLSKNGG
jgi:hypothetical protein